MLLAFLFFMISNDIRVFWLNMSYYVHTCFVFGFGTSRNSWKLIEIRRKSIFERFRDSF